MFYILEMKGTRNSLDRIGINYVSYRLARLLWWLVLPVIVYILKSPRESVFSDRVSRSGWPVGMPLRSTLTLLQRPTLNMDSTLLWIDLWSD